MGEALREFLQPFRRVVIGIVRKQAIGLALDLFLFEHLFERVLDHLWVNAVYSVEEDGDEPRELLSRGSPFIGKGFKGLLEGLDRSDSKTAGENPFPGDTARSRLTLAAGERPCAGPGVRRGAKRLPFLLVLQVLYRSYASDYDWIPRCKTKIRISDLI